MTSQGWVVVMADSARILQRLLVVLLLLLDLVFGGCSGSGTGTAPSDPDTGVPRLVGANVPLVYCFDERSFVSPFSVYVEVERTLLDPHFALLKLFPDENGNPYGFPICDWESFWATGTIQFDNITLEPGTYWAVVSLQWSQPDCTISSSAYASSDTLKTHVADSICATFTKRMIIEYDAQRSWSLKGQSSVAYIDSAFGEASTLIQMTDDQVNLDNYVPPDTQSLLSWLESIWTTDNPIQLVGLPDFGENTSEDIGWTLPNWINQYGEPGCHSMVFRQIVRSKYSGYPYLWGVSTRWEVVNKITVHELGHSRAALTHPQDDPIHHSTPVLCIMSGLVLYQNQPVNNRWFCDSCLARIEAETW